jgi:cyclophilin family peptidyl-prolyl cis-trans isomerase
MKQLLTATLASLVFLSLNSFAGPSVKFETTAGDFVIELDSEKAPVSSENFLAYVNSGFYDGTIFHRIIPDFMVQGGGFTAKYERKEPLEPIVNEGGNGLRNYLGTVAMARSSAPDSATSQFFINVKDNDFLNYQGDFNPGYAVFGTVTEGLELLLDISVRPTGPGGPFATDVPAAPVIILKASVIDVDTE